MKYKELSNEQTGLILSTVGACIGNWARGEKSGACCESVDQDSTLDFDLLKRAICHSIDVLVSYCPAFQSTKKTEESRRRSVESQTENNLILPFQSESSNSGDSEPISSSESESIVLTSQNSSEQEQKQIEPTEPEPIVSSQSKNDSPTIENSENIETNLIASQSEEKTPKRNRKPASSESSSEWSVTPIKKKNFSYQVVDDDEDSNQEESNAKTPRRERKTSSSSSDWNATPIKTRNRSKKAVKGNKTPIKEESTIEKRSRDQSSDASFSPHTKRLRFRDREANVKTSNSLYLPNLPYLVTSSDIKALSVDILDVRIIKLKSNQMYAFLAFDSCEKAEENRQRLFGKTLGGRKIMLLNSYKNSYSYLDLDKKSYILHLTNLKSSITKSELRKMFPDVDRIYIHSSYSRSTSYASLHFSDEAKCLKARDEANGIKYKGLEIKAFYDDECSSKPDDKPPVESSSTNRSRKRT